MWSNSTVGRTKNKPFSFFAHCLRRLFFCPFFIFLDIFQASLHCVEKPKKKACDYEKNRLSQAFLRYFGKLSNSRKDHAARKKLPFYQRYSQNSQAGFDSKSNKNSFAQGQFITARPDNVKQPFVTERAHLKHFIYFSARRSRRQIGALHTLP